MALLATLVVAAPWLVSTPIGRNAILTRLNREFSPGSLSCESWSISWNGPIVLSGLSLRDPRGKEVAVVERVELDRGLLSLATDPSRLGTLSLEGARLDIERRSDGSIDLIEALGQALDSEDREKSRAARPAMDLVLKRSTIRLNSPELETPLEASEVDATAKAEPAGPIDFAGQLRDRGHSLQISGRYESEPGRLSLQVKSQEWPVAVRRYGIIIRGRLNGGLRAGEADGNWSAEGDLRLDGFEADGPALVGDRPRLDRLAVEWTLTQKGDAWSLDRLAVRSPVANLDGGGSWPVVKGSTTRLSGSVDLAALAKQAPHALRIREGLQILSGQLKLSASAERRGEAEHLDLNAEIAEFQAVDDGDRIALREPAEIRASLDRNGETVRVEALSLHASGVDAKASGDLDAGVSLKGTIDLKLVEAQLGDLLDLGDIALAGRGGIAADYHRTETGYTARMAAEFRDMGLTGLSAHPIRRDKLRLDASVQGPHDPWGLPIAWEAARFTSRAGDDSADLAAKKAGDALSIVAGVQAAVTSPFPGRAEAKAVVLWNGRSAQIDDLRIGLVPSDPRQGTETIGLAARGRFDFDRGELQLTPMPGLPAGAVGIGDAGLKASGLLDGGTSLRVEGSLVGDLVAVDRLLAASGSAPIGLGGKYAVQVDIEPKPGGVLAFHSKGQVHDLAVPSPLGLVNFDAQGEYQAQLDALELPQARIGTRYGSVAVGIRLTNLSKDLRFAAGANIDPRWDRLNSMLSESLGSPSAVAGKVRPVQLRGRLAGGTVTEILRGLEGLIAIDLEKAEAMGVEIGATPIILRLGGGRAAFDPIKAPINGGRSQLLADLALEDPRSLALRLGDGSRIDHAEINDVVSSALLAYVAPVLSQATEVDGYVNLVLRRASFPIFGDGTTLVDGDLTFDQVVCQPGPFAAEVLALTNTQVPRLALNQPVRMQIADRRVKQNGLEIPIGGENRVKLAGTVGFDQTLQIRARVPVTGRMLGRDEIVQQLLKGMEVTVPIGGSLAKPGIDRQGLQVALREAAQEVAKRGMQVGAGRLIERAVGRVAGAAASSDEKPADSAGSVGKEAEELLKGLGREIFKPRKP
ncbi:MAG: hypothetical protein U0800_26470 [Isosphaeraceae bacterium]